LYCFDATSHRTEFSGRNDLKNPWCYKPTAHTNILYIYPHMQMKELAEASSQRVAEAAAVRSAAAAEAASQQLLLALSAAESAAQEKLQDLLRCIEDVAAQVCGVGGWGWGGGLCCALVC
jgi:hypothetical protein